MIRKALRILSSFALLLAIVACGAGDQDAPSTVEPPPPVPPAEPEAPSAGAASGPYADTLEALNDVCGDTWCEGEYDWTFRTLTCEGTTCTLGVDVRSYDETTDDLTAPTHHDLTLQNVTTVTEAGGEPSEALFEAVSAAIREFEDAHR